MNISSILNTLLENTRITSRSSVLILCSIGLFSINAQAAQLWYNQGTATGWDDTLGYTAGITTVSNPKKSGTSAIKCYLPKTAPKFGGKWRQDMRATDVGGRYIVNQYRRYEFFVRCDDISKMMNNSMHCWFYQSIIKTNVNGNIYYKPIVALTVLNNNWNIYRYSGVVNNGVNLDVEVASTNAKADNGDWVKWRIDILHKKDNTGYVRVWKNGSKVVNRNSVKTWFDNIGNGQTDYQQLGLMNYLVSGFKGNCTKVTTYFDEITIKD